MAVFRSGDRIADALGIDPKGRQLNVETLFLSTERNPGAYWLQLLVATGIAHMGLTLDSTAVIIGAMLVSPLMTPIVQVGMGFAIGHLHLALRAGRRLLTSIFVVIGLSALTSWLAPFNQPTGEILARTQPTVLDLIVALFCGLAAAFTAARGSKDTVTAAAGTAIAIALVPPLCVVGFGVGTGSGAIAGGASLLFIANLAAIILVGDFFFLINGFAQIDIPRLEQRVYEDTDRSTALYRFAKSLPIPAHMSRSLSLRLLLPITFVGLVSVPLSRALSQVLWQVRVKGAIGKELDRFESEYRVIQRVLSIAPAAISLRLSIVGEPERRLKIEDELRVRLAAASGLNNPSVVVHVVPDAEAVRRRLSDNQQQFADQLANLTTPSAVDDCPPLPPPVDTEAIAAVARAEGARAALAGLKPTDHLQATRQTLAGILAWTVPKPGRGAAWLGWALVARSDGVTVELEHLAEAPAPAAVADTLANVLRHETGLDLAVHIRHLPRILYQGETPPDAPTLAHLRDQASAHRLPLEATAPGFEGLRPRAAASVQLGRAALESAFGDRLTLTDGPAWTLSVPLPARRHPFTPPTPAAPAPDPPTPAAPTPDAPAAP